MQELSKGTIVELIGNTSPKNFKGDDFKYAPQFLAQTCAATDGDFNDRFPVVVDILRSAKAIGIDFVVDAGNVKIYPRSSLNSGLTGGLWNLATSMCVYLTIALSRYQNLKIGQLQTTSPAPAPAPVPAPAPALTPVPEVEKKCWCVVNGKLAEKASTGHRCGYFDGYMGKTEMINGKVEHIRVQCMYIGQCMTKGCLHAH